MVKLNRISKRFGDKQILHDISCEFRQGQFVVITGDSGAGKTTFLRVLMGLEEFVGEIVWQNHASAAVFQEDRLLEEMNVLENIRIVLPTPRNRLFFGASAKAIRAKQAETIRRSLAEVGLEGELDTTVKELSGGMKRRVSILRALEKNADVLFFDEALRGLDADSKAKTLRCIRNRTEGKTVFWVTHDPKEVEDFAAEREILHFALPHLT